MSIIENKIKDLQEKLDNLYVVSKEEYNKLKNDKEMEINNLKEDYNKLKNDKEIEINNLKDEYLNLQAKFEEYKNTNYEEDKNIKNYICTLFRQNKLTLDIVNKYNYLFDKEIIKFEDIPHLKYNRTENNIDKFYIQDKSPIIIKDICKIYLFKIIINHKYIICYYYSSVRSYNIIMPECIHYIDDVECFTTMFISLEGFNMIIYKLKK